MFLLKNMNLYLLRLTSSLLLLQFVICYRSSIRRVRHETSMSTSISPVKIAVPGTIHNPVATKMTSWSYKTLPEDFIVIEDRALENYGRNFSTMVDASAVNNEPDIAYVELSNALGEEQLVKLENLSEASQTSLSGLESISLKISPVLTKEGRTKFHQNIRKIYPTVDSKTEQREGDGDTTYILIYPKGAKSLSNPNNAVYDDNNKQKGGRKEVVVQRWDRSKPDYLHFTVAKSMLSTADMIDKLARMTNMLPTRFEFCGSKDKRAITLQRVSSWRVDQEMVAKVLTDYMLVRDVCVAAQPLRLGDLAGNFFAITLRKQTNPFTQNSLLLNEKYEPDDILKSITNFANDPFINIFGNQRFGSPLPSNPDVGKRLLSSDYRGAVLMMLLAPSTEMEVKIGGLDLNVLNQWLNEAMSINNQVDKVQNYDSRSINNLKDEKELNYFSFLSMKWEEYVHKLNIEVDKGRYDMIESVSKGAPEEEKQGSNEWNDFLSIEARNDARNEDFNNNNNNNEETYEDNSERDNVYESENKDLSPRQINARKDLNDRLLCVSYLLKGDPFDIPKGSSFLQKKILNSFYEEMSRKCEGDLLRASFSRVFSVLPKALRQLFINSYQSIIWNEFAMKRFHNNIHNDIPTNPNDTSIIDDHIPTTTINEINYSNKNVVELKNMLREKSLKLSGKKDELIARLEAYDKLDIFGKTSIGDSLGKNKNIDNIMESTAKISDRPSTFFVSDTAVVGDIVLVDLHKNPLSAWHVAAQNISLNGNHIPLWSSTPVLIRANFDALRDESDSNNYVGGASLDRSNNRHNVVGGRGDGGRGRGRGRGRGGVSVDEDKGEERAEITEIKACYHVISKEDEVACLYPIESVIIPLPGDATYNPKEGEMTKRLLAEKMQVLLIGNHQDKIFRLAGAYRHLVTVAKNVRLAPVRKMKNDLNSIDSADDSKNEIDEDIIYNDWSYNGDKESMDATIEKRKTYDKQIYKKRYDILENSEKIKKIEKGIYRDDLKNKDTGLNMPVEKTRWMKINSNLNQKSVSDTHLSPFSSKVEKLWESNILPNLIADIYEGSTTTSKKGLPGLPSSLSRTIEDRNIDINDSNIDTIQNLDDVDNVLEIEGIRISFSLCASTYATTYLEHLVETMNSQ